MFCSAKDKVKTNQKTNIVYDIQCPACKEHSNICLSIIIIIPPFIPFKKLKRDFVSIFQRGIPLVNKYFGPHRSSSSHHQLMLC